MRIARNGRSKERDHAEDCDHVLDEKVRIQALKRKIEILGKELDEEQRAKLI
jgi:hypothetical protein